MSYVDISEYLPMEAESKGYRILSIARHYEGGNYVSDHAYLSYHGKAVHSWPYYPTLGEVDDAYKAHEKELTHA